MATFLRPNKSKLKNAQHFEFIDAFITLLVAAGLSSAKIAALLIELQSTFGEENRLYMIARASEIIAQRNEADRDRDDKYSRLHAIIRAWAGSGNPTLDALATALKKPFDLYKVKTSAQLEEESGQLDNLITDLSTSAMQQNLTALGVMWLYEQMVAAHQLTKSLRLEQGAEESEKVTGALKAARQKCDELYDKIKLTAGQTPCEHLCLLQFFFGEMCGEYGKMLYLCGIETKVIEIMPQLFTLFGLRFMFYSNDHEPIHVHVVKGGAEARFQVQPEVTLLDNRGLKPAELKLAESIVEENKEIIAARWNEYFKNQK